MRLYTLKSRNNNYIWSDFQATSSSTSFFNLIGFLNLLSKADTFCKYIQSFLFLASGQWQSEKRDASKEITVTNILIYSFFTQSTDIDPFYINNDMIMWTLIQSCIISFEFWLDHTVEVSFICPLLAQIIFIRAFVSLSKLVIN